MKIMENRAKIYLWLVVILVVTNLATIGSVLYHVYAEHNAPAVSSTDIPGEQRTRFLSGELALDETQTEQFRELNRNFNRTANPITRELEELRLEMLEEMSQAQPDTLQLNDIAFKIGSLHTALKKTTIDFYMQMKAMCNEDQQIKLYQLFQSMLNPGNDVNLPRGGRHQYGKGGRYGNRNNQ